MISCRIVALMLAGVTACSAFGLDDSADPLPPAPVIPPADGGSDGSVAAGVQGPGTDLAADQQTPADIVTDTKNIYWLNRASGTKLGAIMKRAKSGGAPAVLSPAIPLPYSMTSNATHIYFTSNDDGNQFSFLNLYRQDKTGGVAERNQLGANGTITGCTIESGVVFAAQQYPPDTNAISSLDGQRPAWTGAPADALPGKVPAVSLLAADLTHVYAVSSGSILKIARADGQSILFAKTTGTARAIVFDPDASSIYWADASAVRSLATSTPGAAPTDLATDQPGPSAIAFDATTIYWTTVGTGASDGSVRSVAKRGGASQTISTGEGEPLGIAVDGSGLYWTNHGDGRIRTAKR